MQEMLHIEILAKWIFILMKIAGCYIIKLQDVDKRVPTIFDYERMRVTLNDALSNQFKNAEEITEVVRITTDQPHGLDFMEQIIVMRKNDKPDSFSEADFKYLNKNDIEDLYYLFRNKKVNYRETKLMNSLITFIRSRVICERVHDFQLGIKSYQIKVNLITPTLTFPGIEAHESYSIVDKPSTGVERVPTGRYVVPTGRVIATISIKVPTGRYIVPAGYIISPGIKDLSRAETYKCYQSLERASVEE
ncbi:hypothetical protein Tco_0575158 [Tanacetum coccineum]